MQPKEKRQPKSHSKPPLIHILQHQDIESVYTQKIPGLSKGHMVEVSGHKNCNNPLP